MMMRFLMLLSVMFGLWSCFAPQAVSAQGLNGFLEQADGSQVDAQSRIEGIMQLAAENGVGVVVIDWMLTGAAAPMRTPPTFTLRVFLR